MHVTRKEWYQRVNAEWPDVVPELTADEAVRALRKLWRFATGETMERQIIVTSGNRYTRRRGVWYVNPERGWKDLVHILSHYTERSGHNGKHARMERRMIREVKRRGWLTGSLRLEPKPESPRKDVRAERYQRIQARIAKWEAKQKRAERALAKLRRQVRYYERVVA